MVQTQSISIWDRLQNCDPRWLYLIFALMMVALQFFTVSIPVSVPKSVTMLYDRIEKLPANRTVLIDCSMDVGYIAEGRGTLEVLVRHLFARKIPFVVYTNTTFYQGQMLATSIIEPIAKDMKKEYGKDYCFWAAVVLQNGAELQSLAKDIHGTIKVDIGQKPLAEIPMMKNVRDIRDISLVYRIAYTWDAVNWIGFIQGVYGTPYAIGTAAISSSSAYTYIDSGQMCGMLAGAAGSAAYESLLIKSGHIKTPGGATKIVMVQSFATLYVIGAIVLGNIAMLLAKMRKKRLPQGT